MAKLRELTPKRKLEFLDYMEKILLRIKETKRRYDNDAVAICVVFVDTWIPTWSKFDREERKSIS